MTAADNFSNLLVIHEEEAEDWAAYIRSILQNDLPEGVLLYKLEELSMEHLPILSCYQCKLLILSQGLLDILDDIKVSFLADLLRPPDNVVILLCGVDNSDALYELAPIQRACHELFADQDAEDFLSVIISVIYQGNASTDSYNAYEDFVTPDDSEEKEEPSWDIPVNSPTTEMKRISVLVLPKRISCENPEEIIIVLKEGTVFGEAIEIEFTTNGQNIRVQPDVWNEKVLRIKAPDFPAGTVNVSVYYDGVIRATAEIEYYTAMGEIETLLRKAAHPVNFICRAFNVDSQEKLDDILTNSLRGTMAEGEVSNFLEDAVIQNQDICQSGEYPTLLHFATKFGFKNLTSLLTQCPGAVRAARMINGDGDDPASLAKKHGHEDLQQLLQKVSISTWENEYLEQGEEEPEDESIYVAMHSASEPPSTMALYEKWQEDLLGEGKEDEADDEEGEADEAEDEAEESSENYQGTFDYADNLYDEIEGKESTTKGSNPFHYDTQPRHASLPAACPLMPEDGYVFSPEQSWKLKQDSKQLWMDQEAYRDEEDEEDEEEDPYSLASHSDVYDHILSTGQEEKRKGRKSFIINRPPAPAPRPPPSVIPTNESSTPFIAQVFQQKTTTKLQADDKDVYSLRQPVRPLCETYVSLEKHGSLPSGQEELILLQEKVKQGLMTMDEALEKFKQWQNEQSGSDQAQKAKLRQLRGCIIGSRPEENYLYDKITIVHQPKAAPEKTRRAIQAIDTVYVKLNKPRVPPRVPRERDQGNLRTFPKIK